MPMRLAGPPRGRPSVRHVTAPQPPTGAGSRLSDTMHGFPAGGPSRATTPTPPRRRRRRSARSWSAAATLKGRRLPIKVPVVNIGRARLQRRRHRRPERQHHARQAAAAGRRLGPDRPGLHQRHLRRGRAAVGRGRARPGHHDQVRRRGGAVRAARRPCRHRCRQRSSRDAGGSAVLRRRPGRGTPAIRTEAQAGRRAAARAARSARRHRAQAGPPTWLVAAAHSDRRCRRLLAL